MRARGCPLQRPARIVHVVTGLGLGGAELMLLRFLDTTDRMRVEHIVVSLMDEGVLGQQVQALGVPLYTLGMRQNRVGIGGIVRLWKLLTQLKPQIVQGWMYHGNLIALVAAKLSRGNAKVLWNIRSIPGEPRIQGIATALLIRASAPWSRFTAGILYNSQAALGAHNALGYDNTNAVVLQNGFDTELFAPAQDAGCKLRVDLGFPPEAVIIGHVGRYHLAKDYETLLHAAAICMRGSQVARFVLVGTGVDLANTTIREQVNSLGLSGAVRLLGVRRDIAELTAGFDIATSSSRIEGFSNAIGEAMSCGVPCVATDVGDARAIIGNTGYVVPPGDPASLAQSWGRLLALGRTGREQLGRAARQRVVERYGLRDAVARYAELYDRTIAELEEH